MATNGMGTFRVLGALVLGALVPTLAYAQGSINGVVRDSTGAVLPGVTVEAASPVLIEKVRSTVTDGAGAYRITDLRPGTYSVTFTLTGFNAFKRDGIEISGTFTASVDAALRVGAIEETVTVTGETPIVDISTTKQERVLDKDIVRDIPSSRQYYSVAVLIPGVVVSGQTIDAGGSATGSTAGFSIHGGRTGDGRVSLDGITIGQRGSSAGIDGAINLSMYQINVGAAQETVISTAGGLGESESSGLAINVVPREGGNTHRGSFYFTGSNGTFQSSNYTSALAALGLRSANQLDKLWEISAQEGGPLVRDKLWYFLSGRSNGTRNTIAGMYNNLNAGDVTKWTYVPDLSRQAIDDTTYKSLALRLTIQPTTNDKIGLFWDEQDRKTGFLSGGSTTSSPEATSLTVSRPDRAFSGTWSETFTNHVLFEGGFGGTQLRWGTTPRPGYNPALLQVTDQAGENGSVAGITFRGARWDDNFLRPLQTRGSVSYVTGTHTAKIGFSQIFINYEDTAINLNPILYQFNNFVPNQFTITDEPRTRLAHINTTGVYAQDSWKVRRLTLQGGVRYDHLHSFFDEQVIGPTQYSPRIDLAPAEGASVHDITPRMAATYDLRGNGKTALKVTLGKYIAPGELGAWGEAENPILRIATSTARSWNDVTGTFNPILDGCDPLNPNAQIGKGTAAKPACGAYRTAAYGTSTFNNTFDPAMRTGWGKRSYNWEFAASVQHELLSRVAVDVGYYRRMFGNQIVTVNRALDGRFGCGTPTDHSGCFDRFNYTVPVDPRLPNGGGYTLVGFQDIKPVAFGQTDNFITSVDTYGGKTEYWQGVDITANVRAFKGLTAQGGVSTGRTTVDECGIAAQFPEIMVTAQSGSPFDPVTGNNQSPVSNCRVQEPFLTQVKGLATYLTPKFGVLLSATYQNYRGPQLAANFNAPNAVIVPLLNRNLAGNAATTALNLATPGTLYGDRLNLLDLRFAKVLKYGRTRTNVSVDLYNSLNVNTAQTYSQTYSSPTANYLTPTLIVPARFVRFNVQLDF